MPRHAWSGVIPILATPFNAEGELDLRSLESLVEFALRSGASGVAVNGMASEWFCLSRAERQQIVDVVAGTLPPESLFVVGAHGHSATQLAEEISGLPRRDRIDAVMVMPPGFVPFAATELPRFYSQIVNDGGLPVMVQDASAASGVNIPVPILLELSSLDGVACIKLESRPTIPKLAEFTRQKTDGYPVFGGNNAELYVDEHIHGLSGTMPACEFTDALVRLHRLLDDDKFEEADLLHRSLLPLLHIGVQPGVAWGVHKRLLVSRGLISSDAVRSPLRRLDDAIASRVDRLFTEWNNAA